MSSQEISNKQSGFSLVEMLIAMTIVGGVFAILYNFGRLNAQRVSSESNTSCEQIARSSLDNLRSYGIERAKAGVSIQANQIYRPSNLPSNSGTFAANDAWRGNGSVMNLIVPQGANQPAISNSYLTSVGAMSALAGLYSNNQYCSSQYGLPYTNANLLVQGGVSDSNPGNGATDRFRDVNTTLKIQAYELASGNLSCTPFYPIPPAQNATPSGNGTLTYPTGVTSAYGFWVTVYTSYTEANGNTGRCSAASLFQYPVKSVEAADQVTGVINPTDSMNTCQQTMTGSRTDIQLPAQSAGKDWVLLCRDRSVSNGWVANSCPGRTVAAESINIPTSTWVDCRSVTICGVAPVGNGWNGNTLTIIHPSLRWGCYPQLDLRIVDSALNVITQNTIVSNGINAWTYTAPPCNYTYGCNQPYCGSAPHCDPCSYQYCAPPTPPGPPWWNNNNQNSDGGDGHDGGDSSGGGSDGCD